MKTFIVATLIVVGISLRPQTLPTLSDKQAHGQITTIGATNQYQAVARVLDDLEMKAAHGSGLFQCTTVLDASGDIYQSCCVNLWLFRLCAEVNWSAIQRLLPF
ncbi:MAG: hypothetical protein NTZ35_19275 [Ignavibacteriales bacterium]|nr:hypothetical protein [Ignavibacteriales bacterium]